MLLRVCWKANTRGAGGVGGGGPSPRQHPPPCCAGSLRRGCQIHRQVMASRPACGGTPPSRTSGRRGRGLKGGGGREDDLDKKQTGMWPPAIWVWIDRPTGGGSGQLPSPCGRRGGAQTACRRVGFFKQTFQRCGTNRERRAPLDHFFCAHAQGRNPRALGRVGGGGRSRLSSVGWRRRQRAGGGRLERDL